MRATPLLVAALLLTVPPAMASPPPDGEPVGSQCVPIVVATSPPYVSVRPECRPPLPQPVEDVVRVVEDLVDP